MIPLIMLLEKF